VVISVVISPDINELTKLKLISNINSEMNGIANAPITSASRKKSVINDVFKNPLIKP
jgi:F0F1-type ATP synthase delta subunit